MLILTHGTEFVLFYSEAVKIGLADGWRQFKRDVKKNVRTLNFKSDVTYLPLRKTRNDVRRRSLCDVKWQK